MGGIVLIVLILSIPMIVRAFKPDVTYRTTRNYEIYDEFGGITYDVEKYDGWEWNTIFFGLSKEQAEQYVN